MSTNNRLDFIDSARGIAALLVLLQHGLESAGLTNVRSGFGYHWINFGQVGVVTFFLISGFVIPLGIEKWASIKHFALGRMARIYPLYLFILGVNLVAFNFSDFHSMDLLKQIQLITEHILFLQEYISKINCVGASWTLSVEAVWYVFFASLVASHLNKKHKLIAYPISILVILLSFFSIQNATRIPIGRIDLLLLCISGLFTYRFFTKNIPPTLLAQVLTVLAVAICAGQWTAFGYFSHPELSGTSILFSWLLGAAIFFTFYTFREAKFTRIPVLLKTGTYSYSIYLIHPVAIYTLEQTHLHGWSFFASLIALTIALSYLTYNFIEYPFIKLAANYRRKDLIQPPLIKELKA